jgi:integrase
MAQHAIKPDDLLFRTRRGKPVVWVAAKKPNAKKGKVSYTKVSALRMAWLDLLERSKSRWQGSFYTLRHLGGTSYGSRPNVSIVALRDFMGHTNINTTNRYLRAITPRNRKLIEWVTEMLDQANCDAWRD